MCLLMLLLFGGPRLIPFWYFLDQARWNAAFDSILIPILGFLFLPWTLVMYVLVGPVVDGGEWLLIGWASWLMPWHGAPAPRRAASAGTGTRPRPETGPGGVPSPAAEQRRTRGLHSGPVGGPSV